MKRNFLAGVFAVLVFGVFAFGQEAQQAPLDEDATDQMLEQMEVGEEPGQTELEKKAEGISTTPPRNPVLEFIDKTKNPTDWFTWGADLRMREIYQNDHITLNNNVPGHEWHWQRYRTRLWSKVTPLKNFEINSRLVWEFRNFCQPEGRRNFDGSDALFDKLNIDWKNIGGSGFSAKIGRQDIILGDGWLVLDGTPLDGSRTIYFDAARMQYDIDSIKTSIQGIYIEQPADYDTHIEPFNDREERCCEESSRGAILWVTNKSLKDTEINGYFIYRHDDAKAANGNNANIYTTGFRMAGLLGKNKNWKYKVDIAQQVGRKNGRRLCALGSSNRLSYLFNDKYDTQLRVTHEYLSGDESTTGKDEGFDILWGRWPQFSELYVYTWIPETGGRIADPTNLHRFGFGGSINPTKNLQLFADYHLLFANHNNMSANPGFSNNGKFRGQLIAAVMKYQFTEHITGHLLGEVFFPGNYYSHEMNDVAVMVRYELTFSW